MRADAHRNRTRLLAAAAAAFGAGRQPPLEQVARDAGVGIGTLYRHFPTREALVEAVYRHELDALGDGVDALLADHDGAAAALRAWTDRYADFVSTKRGMAGTLKAMIADGTLAGVGTRKGIQNALSVMLEAGAVDGTLRPGIDADDVVTVLVGVFLATEGTDDPCASDGCSTSWSAACVRSRSVSPVQVATERPRLCERPVRVRDDRGEPRNNVRRRATVCGSSRSSAKI